jgi:hypothetical protein
MVLIEFLTLKLTMDAIAQHCNNLAYEQELHERNRQLRARMMQLVAEYEAGSIDKETYSKKEAEILAELDRLTKEINSARQATASFAGSAGTQGSHSEQGLGRGL